MPELPEVEIVRSGLQELLPGRIVHKVTNDNPKSFPNVAADVQAFLIQATIKQVRRRAKVLIIDLSTDYSLVIHLKMTGQMVFIKERSAPGATASERFGAGHPTDSLIGELPDKSTRVIIELDDGSHLYFNDQRKFGWMRLLPTALIPEIDFIKKVGPEPLDKDFTADVLHQRLSRRGGSTIKAAILDQTTLAGVGNIYADEALWGAKIHPATRVKDLSAKQIAKLHQEIVAVLQLSIANGGSSSRNYVNARGGRGNYLDFAKVYKLEGQPCQRCATPLIKIRVAGRGTHICPVCQIL